jgi:hypothetical protein
MPKYPARFLPSRVSLEAQAHNRGELTVKAAGMGRFVAFVDWLPS